MIQLYVNEVEDGGESPKSLVLVLFSDCALHSSQCSLAPFRSGTGGMQMSLVLGILAGNLAEGSLFGEKIHVSHRGGLQYHVL